MKKPQIVEQHRNGTKDPLCRDCDHFHRLPRRLAETTTRLAFMSCGECRCDKAIVEIKKRKK